jgi:hypothetical protein
MLRCCDFCVFPRVTLPKVYLLWYSHRSCHLVLLFDSKSDPSVSKVVQPRGFAGLQLYRGGKFYSSRLVEVYLLTSMMRLHLLKIVFIILLPNFAALCKVHSLVLLEKPLSVSLKLLLLSPLPWRVSCYHLKRCFRTLHPWVGHEILDLRERSFPSVFPSFL